MLDLDDIDVELDSLELVDLLELELLFNCVELELELELLLSPELLVLLELLKSIPQFQSGSHTG